MNYYCNRWQRFSPDWIDLSHYEMSTILPAQSDLTLNTQVIWQSRPPRPSIANSTQFPKRQLRSPSAPDRILIKRALSGRPCVADKFQYRDKRRDEPRAPCSISIMNMNKHGTNIRAPYASNGVRMRRSYLDRRQLRPVCRRLKANLAEYSVHMAPRCATRRLMFADRPLGIQRGVLCCLRTFRQI